MITSNRRLLITGLISFLAAPAIVRAESLMKVKRISDDYFLGKIMITPSFLPEHIGMMFEMNNEMYVITGLSSADYYGSAV